MVLSNFPEKSNSYSDLNAALVEETLARLKELYFADNRPWVVAYSGGKDSTALLQLVFNLLLGLGNNAKKTVFVLFSDTQVEAPNVADYVFKSLRRIEVAATKKNIPLTVQLVQPLPGETFWGKLIGRGYPPPSKWFRWCTSNMKIKPSRRAIEEMTRSYGSVVLLLGTRISESAQRGRSMQAREKNSRGLNPHHEIPNALVASPISSWTTDDVWEFLSLNNCPWEGDHSFLISLYRQASGGECPAVFDLSAPSCGGSRFGCWTCTVVKEDKSLKGFVRSGEDHFQPLIDFRNWLIGLRDKPGYRSDVKRNGHSGPGPFLPQARQEILDHLLALETQTGLPLINDTTLAYIHEEWAREFDFEKGLVNEIAIKYGRSLIMHSKPEFILPPPEEALLESASLENDLNPVLLRELLDIRRRDFPSLDKWGAKSAFERAIGSLVEKAVRQAEQTTQL